MSTAQTLNKTALNEIAKKYNGKLVDFHGWQLPIQFEGILKEHTAVRNSVGIFDVSHMGQIFLNGPDAFKLIQKTNTNDFRLATIGKGVYSHITNETAGIVDDIIGFCLALNRYIVIVNATTVEKDYAWLKEKALKMNVEVVNRSSEFSMIALQGPKAIDMMEKFAPEANKLLRFGIIEKKILDKDCFISRTGYTGEDGFEITAPHEIIADIWQQFMELGKPYDIVPCGLGARDTLRLEAGYLLYGQDADDDHTTIEAGCGWAVCFEKGEFTGRSILLKQKEEGLKRRLNGIILEERGVPRPGSKVFKDGKQIGTLTSATYSPTLKKGIGLGYLDMPKLKSGEEVEIELHSKLIKAKITRMPFHKGSASKI
ncbi:MAG: glycine cleavage system aminomethyltransferase GcvT [Elusimicrobiales bacterium]|nr:glycine cleavage system aminomethyltransferase GcvT [Elusimicrobiales bacterium]